MTSGWLATLQEGKFGLDFRFSLVIAFSLFCFLARMQTVLQQLITGSNFYQRVKKRPIQIHKCSELFMPCNWQIKKFGQFLEKI